MEDKKPLPERVYIGGMEIRPVAPFSKNTPSNKIDPNKPLIIQAGGNPNQFPKLSKYKPGTLDK